MRDHTGIPEWLRHAAQADYHDRQWFKANPGRNFRLRTMFAFEHATPATHDGVWIAVVKQIAPGHRRRAFLLFDATDLPNDDDLTAQHYWRLATADESREPALSPAAA
jgi:hypothetical protein